MTLPFRTLILTFLIALVTISAGVRATEETAFSADEASKAALAELRVRLELTDDQAERFGPLLHGQIKAMRELFDGYSGQGAHSLPSLMTEFEERREKFRVQVEPILNDAQMLKFVEIRKEVDSAMRDTICGYRIEQVTEAIALNDDQVAALKPIFYTNYDERYALISFHTDQSGGARTRQALGAQILESEKKMILELQKVFTSAQMKQYVEQVEGRRAALREKEAVSR